MQGTSFAMLKMLVFLDKENMAKYCLNDWPLSRTPSASQAGAGSSKITVEGAKHVKAQRGLKIAGWWICIVVDH